MQVWERHLHPSVYQKFEKTRELKEKGVSPDKFLELGGLDDKTYEALRDRWKIQKYEQENRKDKIVSKYGSIKAAPLSAGPCKKIDPAVGNKNALVLLVEFKDKKHTHQPVDIEKSLFLKGSKSVRDYFLEVSSNQLDITGKVLNQWYLLPGNRSEYVDEAVHISYPRSRKLVKEALISATTSGNLDFTPFAPGGKIEILMVVCAGKGLDTGLKTKYLRPHQGQLEKPLEVQKGITADRYILVPELPIYDIGCYCHEICHLLGLPDFYNMKSPVLGGWCVMAIGDHNDDGRTPSHPSAWCKVHLGWKEPELIERPPESMGIPWVADNNGKIYKIEVQGSGGREYFLLENRQQKGFDKKLPGSGLLIWHVDENRCAFKPPNSNFNKLFLTLIQSDGGKELQSNISQYLKENGYEAMMEKFIGDEGDAYPGITQNRNFNMESNPLSTSNKGIDSLVRVKSISDSGDIMQAQMGVQGNFKAEESGKTQLTSAQINKTPWNLSVEEIATLTILMNMELMNKKSDPYDMGYEAGLRDILENEMEELKLFTEGYRESYRKEHKRVLKKSR